MGADRDRRGGGHGHGGGGRGATDRGIEVMGQLEELRGHVGSGAQTEALHAAEVGQRIREIIRPRHRGLIEEDRDHRDPHLHRSQKLSAHEVFRTVRQAAQGAGPVRADHGEHHIGLAHEAFDDAIKPAAFGNDGPFQDDVGRTVVCPQALHDLSHDEWGLALHVRGPVGKKDFHLTSLAERPGRGKGALAGFDARSGGGSPIRAFLRGASAASFWDEPYPVSRRRARRVFRRGA